MAIADDASQQPDVIVEEAEFMDAVTDAIAELPEREQLVMQLIQQYLMHLEQLVQQQEQLGQEQQLEELQQQLLQMQHL